MSDPTVDIETAIPICKVDPPRRLITVVVLEPWDGDPATADASMDSQDDVVKAAEVELAAYAFLRKFQRGETFLGFMHGDTPAALELCESWVTRTPIEFETGEKVDAGAWLMTLYVADDGLWAGIESGELDGASLRGAGYRRPV